MLRTFKFVAALILISPIFIFWDGPLLRALFAAYVAAAVASVAWSIRPGEGGYLATVFRPIAISTSLPAAWMVIQILPLPVKSLLHPIWLGAQDALNNQTVGSITIDPGATLVALSHYCSAIGMAFVMAAVTIDRQRAEWALILLAGVTTFVAVLLVLHDLSGLTFFNTANEGVPRAVASAISALGVIITAATLIRVYERFETRRSLGRGAFARTFALYSFAFVMCSCAVLLFSVRQVTFATACGLAILIWVLSVRRLGLGVWFRSMLAFGGLAIATFFALTASSLGPLSISTRFATSDSMPLIEMAQRILSDTSWTGTGAGSFSSLVGIYRAGEDPSAHNVAPTAAANIAIELGWLALWACVLLVVIVAIILLRGALNRGRDSFYVTAAAGCVVLIGIETFCDPSLSGTAVIIIAAAIIGLGVAQSLSRNVQ